MPALTVGGVTISVAEFREEAPFVIGDRAEAWDGTLLSTNRGYKRRFRGKTSELGTSAYATQYAALSTSGAQALGGDLLTPSGVTSGVARARGNDTLGSGASATRQIDFDLIED